MIEISRSVTIGQYIPNGSFINKLDARIKLLGAIGLIVLISIVDHFLADAAILFIALLLLIGARLPLGFILSSFRPAIAFLLFIDIFQVLFYQAPPGQRLTTLWQWGPLTVTIEGLLFTAHITIRVLLLYYFVNLLTFTTSLVEFADGTESLLKPLQRIGLPINELVMVMVVALKFVPIFIAELERTIKAQTARGVKLDSGNIVSRALKIGPLLIPLILSGFQRAEQLTIAMEARGYRGGKGRTKLRVLRIHGRDILAGLLLLLLCAGVVAIDIFYPF